MKFTVIETATGEPLRVLEVSNSEHLEVNIRSGESAVTVPMPVDTECYWVTDHWVVKPARPTIFHTWDKYAKAWTDPRSLAEVRAQRWEAMKAARVAAIDAPLTTPYGVFDCDPEARKNITDTVLLLQTLNSVGTPGTVEYTLYDNTNVTLDLAKIIVVGLLLGQKTQQAMTRGREVRAEIEAAGSIAEVNAIQW